MFDKLLKIVSEDRIKKDEPLSKHTSFNIGGPADYYVIVNNEAELSEILKLAKKESINYFLIGNGSNLLVGDLGIRGLVIRLGGEFDEVLVNGDNITAGAGATLSKVAKAAMDASKTGLEFAAGIPGTVGGALVMNAGAYGGEMKQVVTKVSVLTKDGEIKNLSSEEMKFGYRHSLLKEEELIALKCEMVLSDGDKDAIRNTMKDLASKRKEKQPLEYPSAGSTFKRPEGYFAGKLIEDSGLGGFSINDAQVSEKHKGFVINRGNASAQDVKELIEEVKNRVLTSQGVLLEPEVIMVGEFR